MGDNWMKKITVWRAFAVPVAVGAALLLGGCNLISPPEPVPAPPTPPTPKPGIFNAGDYIKHGVALNAANDENLPDYFEVVRVDSADLIWIRSVDSAMVNDQEQLYYGKPDVVRVAGITTPHKNQPGWHDAVRNVQKWTLGQKLTVEQDPEYPLDAQHRRRVQIFFTGSEGSDHAGETLCLNRMLIRDGYAVVDIAQPTTFDSAGWLNDEQYARERHLGLWGQGILLDHRLPPEPLKPENTESTAPRQVRPASP